MGINGENRQRNGHVLVWNQTDLPAEDARPKSKHAFIFFLSFCLFVLIIHIQFYVEY